MSASHVTGPMRRALDLAATTGRLQHDGNTGWWVPQLPRRHEIRQPRPHAKKATVHALLERGLFTDDRDPGYAWCNAVRITNPEDPMKTPTLQHRVTYATFVGARLKLARELAGLSLTQAAKLLDITPGTLEVLERDKAEMGTPVPKAAAIYGVSARWLTSGARHDVPLIRRLQALPEEDRDSVTALVSILSREVDEEVPVSDFYVLEVREEWRSGRGRWWCPNGQGYTDRLERAGLYRPDEHQDKVAGTHGTTVAVPLAIVLAELEAGRARLLERRASLVATAALEDDAEVADPPVSVPVIPTTATELLALCREAVPALAWTTWEDDDRVSTGVWAMTIGARVKVSYHEAAEHPDRPAGYRADLTVPGIGWGDFEMSPDVLTSLRRVAGAVQHPRDDFNVSYWRPVGNALAALLGAPDKHLCPKCGALAEDTRHEGVAAPGWTADCTSCDWSQRIG